MVAAISRASSGGRPCSAVNSSTATSVRIRARSSAGTGQSGGRPSRWFSAAIRVATSMRYPDTSGE